VNLPPVTIALSSYNGERFIAEQIASIRQQTHRGWQLLVRDDGSSDGTVRMVETHAAGDPRITLLRDDAGNLGPAASFGVLLDRALLDGAEYVALADQDDVWSPTKIEDELRLMLDREQTAGKARPILVHTDLKVVRDDLSVVHDSFLGYQGLRHLDAPLGTLLVQNFVTGSTLLLNRALLEVAMPIPRVIMHDWWLALCAASVGEIAFVDRATVLYRQHGSNTLGSVGLKRAVWRSLRNPFVAWLEADGVLNQALDQARELSRRLERERARHPQASQSLAMVGEFCRAFTLGSGLSRLRVVARHGIRPRTFLPYPVRYYARVLLWQRRPSRAGRPAAADPR
jgi:rhamnosyltransferase